MSILRSVLRSTTRGVLRGLFRGSGDEVFEPYGPNLWTTPSPLTFTAYENFTENEILTIGQTYLVEFTYSGTGQLGLRVGSLASNDFILTNSGTFSQEIVCDAGGDDARILGAGGTGYSGTVTGMSVRLVNP